MTKKPKYNYNKYENPMTWKEFKRTVKEYGGTDQSIVFGSLKMERPTGLKYTFTIPKPKLKKVKSNG